MYKEHPVFEKPENENVKIWRYMDFTKFMSLLDRSALFFTRADKLGDPFEGSFPKVNVELRPEIYKDKIPPSALKSFSKLRMSFLKCTIVNCWHLNEYESAAMWKLYLKSNEGIGIQSTFNRLINCLKDGNHHTFIGRVKYIDYEKDWIPEGNSLIPFVRKRKSFEHERELRAVIQDFSYNKNGEINLLKPPFDEGLYIPVDLNLLVDRVYLAPTSPKWLFELVESVIKKYHLKKEVHQSSLDEVPVF